MTSLAATHVQKTENHVPHIKPAWWKECSVYQIYPSSFKDSNGDGMGDIPGIIEKLDYIEQLGVDIVWLCPVYKSPMVDMGYDIADYRDIDPQYGNLADLERLIEGLHERGLKFLMDLVVNHTSDQHVWFQSSKSSKDNEYRDWYIWRKPKYDFHGNRQPPNNWSSYFGGSAWEYDAASDEYYLHLFAKEQPDLNWEHLPARDAVYDIVRFWLDKGVDGFRMDVINLISKAPGLPDAKISNPTAAFHHGSEHYACGPRLHEYLKEIGSVLNEYNAFSVGEMPFVSDAVELLKSVGQDRGELNMIFNFDIVDMDHGSQGKFSPKQWSMADLKSIVNKWQTFMYDNQGWNALYLENHDQSRTVSRWGSDKPQFRTVCAKMFATFLGFQSGTLFLYQGQELGMTNIPKEWDIMTKYRDVETLNHWKELTERVLEDDGILQVAKKEYQLKSRDNARTPMQWDSSPNGGFSIGVPWIRVNDNYADCNAASQLGATGSVFEFWCTVLRLRKEFRDLFIYGDFCLLAPEHENAFVYSRSFGEHIAVVVCNLREIKTSWSFPQDLDLRRADVLLSNYSELRFEQDAVLLRPFEAFVCMCDRHGILSSHL